MSNFLISRIFCHEQGIKSVSMVLSALAVYNVNTLYFFARSFPEKSAKTGNLSTIKTQCPNQLSCSRIRWSLVWRLRKRKSLSLIQGLGFWIWPLVAMEHKITNVPLILIIWEIIFCFWANYFMGHFSGYFEGSSTFLTPKLSLEMAHKVIVPQKKIMSRSFLNSRTLIVKIHEDFNPSSFAS